MSRPRLAPGTGKSPRFSISISEAQRQALEDLTATTGKPAAELARQALDAWLNALAHKELPQAS
jgi:hypothetical protein